MYVTIEIERCALGGHPRDERCEECGGPPVLLFGIRRDAGIPVTGAAALRDFETVVGGRPAVAVGLVAGYPCDRLVGEGPHAPGDPDTDV